MTEMTVHQQSTALAIRDDQTEFDERQVAILRSLGVEKANRGDLALFFHVAKRTGLDPFARQIYMIERWTKDGPKQTIQTGIDGLRLIAQRTCERSGEHLSYEDTQWCGEDGAWRDVWLSKEPPAAARVVVLRGAARFPAVALFHEYAQTTKKGDLTQMWGSKGALMLAKCAEALALRKAFPQDLSGIYTPDELGDQRQPKAAPTVSVASFQAQPEPAPAPEPAPVADEPVDAEVVEPEPKPLTDRTRKRMFALFSERGIADDEQLPGINHLLGTSYGSRADLTEDDAARVIAHLEGGAS